MKEFTARTCSVASLRHLDALTLVKVMKLPKAIRVRPISPLHQDINAQVQAQSTHGEERYEQQR